MRESTPKSFVASGPVCETVFMISFTESNFQSSKRLRSIDETALYLGSNSRYIFQPFTFLLRVKTSCRVKQMVFMIAS